MTGAGPATLHASAVAIWRRGVLILGSAGSGKSGLALRLIGLGATLVADDRVILTGSGSALAMSAPLPLAGLIEARGIGILRLPSIADIHPALVVDMDAVADTRLPPIRNKEINSLCLPLIAGKNVPNLEYAITAALNSSDVFCTLDPGDDEKADEPNDRPDTA